MREHGCPRVRSRQRVLPDFPLTPADARHYGLDAIAYVAIASAVVSATVGAYSAYASSQAQSGALEYNAALSQQQAAYQQQMGQLEASLIGWALKVSGGNKSKAAELLQIKRSTLGDRINRCGLGRAAGTVVSHGAPPPEPVPQDA
jgi:DNA-binding NtrC family response regulator